MLITLTVPRDQEIASDSARTPTSTPTPAASPTAAGRPEMEPMTNDVLIVGVGTSFFSPFFPFSSSLERTGRPGPGSPSPARCWVCSAGLLPPACATHVHPFPELYLLFFLLSVQSPYPKYARRRLMLALCPTATSGPHDRDLLFSSSFSGVARVLERSARSFSSVAGTTRHSAG